MVRVLEKKKWEKKGFGENSGDSGECLYVYLGRGRISEGVGER